MRPIFFLPSVPNPSTLCALLVAWVMAVGGIDSSAALAQDGPSIDLRTLRVDYRKTLLAALLPETKSHRDQLLALEHSLAAKADYAGAIRVREERHVAEQDIAAMEHEIPALAAQLQTIRSGALPDRIEFSAKDALVQGLELDAQSGLSGWTPAKSYAQWKLPDLPPGGYEIRVNYACTDPAGAQVILKESFYTLTGVLPAAPDGKPKEMEIGTLRIREGQAPLRMEVLRVNGGPNLRVYSVALIPANR